MNEPKPFASLSPSLLARKGGARPAMRPQYQAYAPAAPQFHDATPREAEEDLGWNDMGHDHAAQDHAAQDQEPRESPVVAKRVPAAVVALKPSAPLTPSVAKAADVVKAVEVAKAPAIAPEAVPEVVEIPEIVRQQAAIAERVAKAAAPKIADKPPRDIVRRSAIAEGRRAAFTLRLDAERHLKLRLACTISNRSAQQVVTDALDQFIAGLPDVAHLAAQVRKRG